MKTALRYIIPAFILCILAILAFQPAGAAATDNATDNATAPGLPGGENLEDAVIPSEISTWTGPSTQEDTVPPEVIFSLTTEAQKDILRIYQSEQWYLDFDINTPGWLYIYEYYPPGGDMQGKWIAYKWELRESGSWKLGPFNADVDEPGGQHAYRAWFYSDGQWAEVKATGSGNNIIYWTYSSDEAPAIPVETTAAAETPQPGTESEAGNIEDGVKSFLYNPLLWVLLPAFLTGILGFLFTWRYYRWNAPAEVDTAVEEVETEEESATAPAVVSRGKLTFPNGIEMKIESDSTDIGRSSFIRMLNLDELGLISRQQFRIKSVNGEFFIEDSGSSNGTMLNGNDIKGKGQMSLKDGDLIEPAGAVQLKFYIL